VRYAVPVPGEGPFTVEAELLYQPIGFRSAQNLKPYPSAFEPRRVTEYYGGMVGGATATLAERAALTAPIQETRYCLT